MDKLESIYLREDIRELVRCLGILNKKDMSCMGVTMMQCHTIVEVGRVNKISLNELSKILKVDKSTMSRTINNLVQSNLVTRDTNIEDRRYVTISLTNKGKDVFNTIEETMGIYYEKIYLSIPEEKRPQVLESLNILNDAIKIVNIK